MESPVDQRRRLRLRLAIGVAILLVIGGIVGYGYYDRFVAPSTVLAARVGDTRYTQGDLVTRMRMLQASSAGQGQSIDFSQAPFEVLMQMAQAEMAIRAAPSLNIRVTEAHIQAYLRDIFGPRIPVGQDVRPGQFGQEYRENYQDFLNRSHMSDKDYRRIVEERIYSARLREKLGERLPSIGKHVEVHWIRLPSPGGGRALGAPEPLTPGQISERLETEEFERVAVEVSTDSRYSDAKGYVGWVPKGAFPELDEYLFGSDQREALAHGELSSPIITANGSHILKVTAGPEEREISALMKEKLKDEELARWVREQVEIGGREGWLELNFTSELYAWAIDQVKQAAPRVTPPAAR